MKQSQLAICGSLICNLLFQSPTFAGDWLHYRGPSGNGIAAEDCRLPKSGAAPVLWKTKVGIGTSSVVVGGGRLYTMGHV
ncbi:MAG: hypothetical protein ORN83_13405, partial [Chthoniobacteraceae bacterium]|nr:hypothetical protein [Chthoniobacteraceae bacterium]